jgi:hypothetical protein
MIYKVCIAKNMFENKVQILFLKSLFSKFQRILFKPHFYFGLCKISLFAKIYKVYMKMFFILKTCFLLFSNVVLTFRKKLEFGLIGFGASL